MRDENKMGTLLKECPQVPVPARSYSSPKCLAAL